MNQLTTARRVQIVNALSEGCGVRATSRLTGTSTNTVMKLLRDLGAACAEYQDRTLRGLSCKRLQIDEIWAFVYAKEKNVPAERRGEFGVGDVWTFTAIDAETKLIPTWYVGLRTTACATEFMEDLASRLAERPQITTDGLNAYVQATWEAFGREVDFAQLVKVYGTVPGHDASHRYSPPACIGVQHKFITGQPEREHISTSYVERANLSMRMGMRRFTRLTNGHSKKLENMEAALAIYFMHYNFCRVHSSLKDPGQKTARKTPAMAAGVADHVWAVEEMLALAG